MYILYGSQPDFWERQKEYSRMLSENAPKYFPVRASVPKHPKGLWKIGQHEYATVSGQLVLHIQNGKATRLSEI